MKNLLRLRRAHPRAGADTTKVRRAAEEAVAIVCHAAEGGRQVATSAWRSGSWAARIGFSDLRGNTHTHSRMTPTGSPEGWKWVLWRRIPVSQQPGRSLPVTGLPLENLADLGGPASKLPCVGPKIARTEISVRFHPWGAQTHTHRTFSPTGITKSNPCGHGAG